ncbi:hypothetical protein [Ammoniphilus resinae]|uniref:Uncharacterized protein n=1 Tax=Ammoniphilus resinae TaxID=861532 RepID=A0ABS4GNL7_9BACL|nr:hypothetical protein [Ammoniphilus resinae]MBP1931465.1 hypothetical protein [Ammoniphilus resinae]
MKMIGESGSKTHFIKALAEAKIGRLEDFVRERKGELKQIARQDYSDQTTLLLDMIREIIPECQEVKVKVASDQVVLMNCSITKNLDYSFKMYLNRSPKEITAMLIIQVVLPYTLDLWEQLEKGRGEKEGPKCLV